MMLRQDQETLKKLLTELVIMQDSVTHLNEKGSEFEAQTRDAIAVRDGIRNEILAFVNTRIMDGGR